MNKEETKRLLILSANPEPGGELDPLKIDREIKSINNSLSDSKYSIFHNPFTCLSDLPGLIRNKKPHMVHFAGHGVQEGLFFLDPNGQPKLAHIDGLAELFDSKNPAIECAILNACFSEQQGKVIARYVQNVISMGGAINDLAALEFADEFYKALNQGEDYRSAYEWACKRIRLNHDYLLDHYTPVFQSIEPSASPKVMDRAAFIQEVASHIKAGKLAVCIGPAFSEAAGFPSWREIFQRLDCTREELDVAARDYPAFTTQLNESNRLSLKEFKVFVADQLDVADVHIGPLHESLKHLPFSLVLTSNYDLHIENLRERTQWRVFAGNKNTSRLKNQDSKTHLVYLFGNIEQADEMLLDNDGLQGWRYTRSELRSALEKRLAGQHLLFLGYGASDPLLEAVKDILPIEGTEYYAAVLGDNVALSGISAVAVANPSQLTALLEEMRRTLEGESPTSGTAETVEEDFVEQITATVFDRIRRTSAVIEELAGFEALPIRPLNYLPRRVDRFTGRGTELQNVIAALNEGCPVGITGLMGMGGIGKTSLAIEVAHHCREAGLFPDGVCWHTLGNKEFSASLEEFGSELGMAWLPRFDSLPKRKTAFRSALKGKRLLFILDDANYPQRLPEILDLLIGHPVLVTSRANLSGLTLPITLARLEKDAARLMFLKTWRSVANDDAANALLEKQDATARAAMDAICLELLGGLPLAISLAASLAGRHHWTLKKLVHKLTQKRLDLLNDPNRVDQREAKDRDVRLSFDLSYQLLDDETTRLVLDVTGVFGSEAFAPEALAEAAGVQLETTEAALADLADLSFVERDDDGRVRLHPLTREYAIEHLATLGNQAPWQRMAQHYLELVLHNPKALDYDWRNALHAVVWCFGHGQYMDGLFLVRKIDSFLYRVGIWPEREKWLRMALDTAQALELPDEIFFSIESASDQLSRQGHRQNALIAYEALHDLSLCHKAMSKRIGWCKYVIAALQRRLGNSKKALALDLTNLRSSLLDKDWKHTGAVFRNLGIAFAHVARLDRALFCYDLSKDIQAALNSKDNLPRALSDLFDCFLTQGHNAHAHRILGEMRAELDKELSRDNEALFQECVFRLALRENRLADAQVALDAYTRIARELGMLGDVANSARYSGMLLYAQDRLPEARTSLEMALSQYREDGFTDNEVHCLRWLGLLATRQGDYRQAREWLDEARALAESHGGPEDAARWEMAYALFQAHGGFNIDAVRGVNRALNSFTGLGIGDLWEEKRIVEEIRSRLGGNYARAEARLEAEGLKNETVNLREDEATLDPNEHVITSPVDGREMLLVPSGLVRAAHHEHPFFLYPFYIDRYPVTNRDYLHYLEAMNLPAPPHWQDGQLPSGKDDNPVVGVTWDEARGYAEWCGKKLPLVEEWEVAAGLREGRETPWGVQWDHAYGEERLEKMGFQAVEFPLPGNHCQARHWSRIPSLISIHPLTEFDEIKFLKLLFASLSLSVLEKKRVVDSIATLSQFQIDQLNKVFSDEYSQFTELWTEESEHILGLQKRCLEGLIELEQIYMEENASTQGIKSHFAFSKPLPISDNITNHAFFTTEIAEWCDSPSATDKRRGYSDHACKGGGWFLGSEESIRLTAAARRDPYNRTLDTGFRCVLPVFDKGAVIEFLKESRGVDSHPVEVQAEWLLRRTDHLAKRPIKHMSGANLRTNAETDIALNFCRRALHLSKLNPHAIELYLKLATSSESSLADYEKLLREIDAFEPPPAVQQAWNRALAAEASVTAVASGTFEEALDNLLSALEAELSDSTKFTHRALPNPTPPRFCERTTPASQEYFLSMHREQIPFPLLGPLLASWRKLKPEKPSESVETPDNLLFSPTDEENES